MGVIITQTNGNGLYTRHEDPESVNGTSMPVKSLETLDLSDAVVKDNSPTSIAEKVLDVLGTILLTKLPGAHQKWDQGTPTFIAVIQKFVEKGEPVKMALPAFPWKSANKVEKVLGTLPDKAEEVSLARLNGICERIRKFYRPGAEVLIISDGLVYNGTFT
jgi:hypothetical protein